MIRIEQEDGKENGRFVLFENDVFAGEVTYTWIGETAFSIDHTTVDPKFGGKGFGKSLVLRAAEFAKENSLKIKPLCSYAKKVFDRNEDLQEVLYK